MSALVVVAIVAGTTFAMGLRWWERDPEAGRGGEPWLAATLVATLVLTDLAIQAWIAGSAATVVGLGVCAVLLAPWSVARHVAIPAGAWRAASVLGRVSGWAWRGDTERASLVAAAAALAHRPDPVGVRWVARRLGGDVSAPAVVARAALAAARGDRARARALAEVASDFAEGELPSAGRELARVMDARWIESKTAEPSDRRPASLFGLCARWESDAADASLPARAILTEAIQELAGAREVPLSRLSTHAPSLLGYRGDDEWARRFDDLERRLDRSCALDPEAELHRWTRLRCDLETLADSRATLDAALWLRGERLLQRFAVRLHEVPEGAPLAISVLRWVRARAWAMGDVHAAESAHANLALAQV